MALAKKKEEHQENTNTNKVPHPSALCVSEKKRITEKYTVIINKEENKPLPIKKLAIQTTVKNECKQINILKDHSKIKPDANTKFTNNYVTATENKKLPSNNFIIESNAPLHIIPKEPQIFKVKTITSNFEKKEITKPKLVINSDTKPNRVIPEFGRRASCTPDPKAFAHIKDLGMELFTNGEIESVNSKAQSKFMSCRRQSMNPIKVNAENSFEMEWE
jgi:hypothetical protein